MVSLPVSVKLRVWDRWGWMNYGERCPLTPQALVLLGNWRFNALEALLNALS